ASNFVMKSGIVGITPTGDQRKVTTRRLYRASVSDPEDPAYGIVLHNEGEGVIYRNFAVYLECDYTDTANTNLGADWDIGVFNSRGGFKTENLAIIGPFRVASYYQDTTRSYTLPEFSSIDGVQFPDGTIASGSDNVQHTGALWTGGRWGEGHLGAKRCVTAVAAVGTITVYDIAIADETFTIDDQVFTFKASRTTTGEVTIGANAAAAVTNIVAAITADLSTVAAADGEGNTVVVTAAAPGTDGNFIVFTESASNIVFSGSGALGSTVYGIAGVSSCSGKYYDTILAAAVTDNRGSSGSSDYSHSKSVITGPLHHSGYRWTDPIAVNPLTIGGYLAELTSSGASYIDGYAGISAARFTKQTYGNNCRFVSWEPFNVRLDHVGNIRFNDSHWEYGGVTVTPAAGGTAVAANDLVNYGYGPITATANTGTVIIQAPSTNVPAEAWFWNIPGTSSYSFRYLVNTDNGKSRQSSCRTAYNGSYQADNFGKVLFKWDENGITSRNIQTFKVSLDDNEATSIYLGEASIAGMGFISTNGKALPQVAFTFRNAGAATDYCQAFVTHASVTYSDDAILTGSTGSDTKLNLSVSASEVNKGKIYIENRLGDNYEFLITVFTYPLGG
ncbi:MAG: hypothetical protein WC373_14510, partial [Smithella sp.]